MAKARATAHKDQGKLFEEKPVSSQEKGPQLFWGGALFNENYLRVDVPQKYKQWENDEYGPFKTFTEKFLDLCQRLDEEKFDSWSETETINNWIVKIMKLLGWHSTCESDDQNPYMEQVSFTEEGDDGKKRTYRPDLLYVDYIGEKKAIASSKNVSGDINQAHKLVRMVVEAKYWNRLEEYGTEKGPDKKRNDHDNDDVRCREPEEQLLKYIRILDKDFGILTDGKVWRLLHKNLSEGSGQYRTYQFDLGQLRELALKIHEGKSRQLFTDAAKYFYFFFSKESFYPEKGISLISDVLEFNKKYASQIEEDLKKRFISAMSITCNGFNRTACARSPEDLAIIRDVAESHIFNILFIRSCEVRDILSLKNMEYLKISLSEIVNHFADPALPYSYNPKVSDELNVKYMEKNFNSGKDSQYGKFSANGTEIYDRLINLYKVIYDGSHDFKIAGFKETVFSKDEWKFAKAHKLNNSEMLKLLFNLCYIEGTTKGTFQQIPYNYFTPRQLGSIYESFLEYALMKAEEDMAFVDRQWKPANIESNKVKDMGIPTVRRGDLFFTPNNSNRKDTGSFYTPDNVVQYIIKETLEPLIRGKKADDLKTLNICDPAMGSGHFLNGVLNYLTDQYIAKKEDERLDDLKLFRPAIKRDFLHSSIYGVDINPRAVKLAKMSLWLETAYNGIKLERLDDQLKIGDSFIDDRKMTTSYFSYSNEFSSVFSGKSKGFSAITSNPPWGRCLTKEQERWARERFSTIGKEVDTYTLFIERAQELLADGGRLGAILPSTYLVMPMFQSVRSFIVSNYQIDLLGLIKAKVFKDATVESSILVAVKTKPKSEYTLRTFGDYISTEHCSETMCEQRMLSEFVSSDGLIHFNVGSTASDKKIMDKIVSKCSCKLADKFTVKSGIMTNGEALIKSKKENRNCKPLIRGSHIFRGYIDWADYYIEYDQDLAEKYKYQLRDESIFLASPKIIIRQTGDSLVAAVDDKQFYSLKNTHLIIKPKGATLDEMKCT